MKWDLTSLLGIKLYIVIHFQVAAAYIYVGKNKTHTLHFAPTSPSPEAKERTL